MTDGMIRTLIASKKEPFDAQLRADTRGHSRHPDDPMFSSVTIMARRVRQTQRKVGRKSRA